jgi:DNA-binding XRE family transcriptional regulator
MFCYFQLKGGTIVSDDINKAELMAIMADKLVLLRTNLNMKQGDLASKVGISIQTLYEYKKKKCPISIG